MIEAPLRILLAALGGEGGGVLMNWIVEAARAAGHPVQATSVPGVAQRTGSTSYYIEVAAKGATDAVLSLVPMPARVDVVVSSELLETARLLETGYISDRTTLISSTERFFTTAEKIQMGDGRYEADNVITAAQELADTCILLDLERLATENGTFVSATMFGALAASGSLPWDIDISRAVLSDSRSLKGFDAAAAAVRQLATDSQEPVEEAPNEQSELEQVIQLGIERAAEYQDVDYGALFQERAQSLMDAADLTDHRAAHAVTEACRRLALWMAYEDIARVADLKTRPERFAGIGEEVQLEPGQVLTITEYLKPRAEEIADVLPAALGRRIMARVDRGGWFPFLGKGRYIRSNGVIGFWMLRLTAKLKRIRRRSLRFAEEQAAIEEWVDLMRTALGRSPDFAMALGDLPRVLKGYSDTLARGKAAYGKIMDQIVRPAVNQGTEAEVAGQLRRAIGAALADDTHNKLDAALSNQPTDPEIPNLGTHANA